MTSNLLPSKKQNAVTSITSLPSLKNDAAQNTGYVQGIEKFIDTMNDQEYAMMIEDEEFKPAFLYAKRRRESWLNRKAIDNKAANGCKMLLMQEENGGYSDRPVENKEKKFIVKLEGVGVK